MSVRPGSQSAAGPGQQNIDAAAVVPSDSAATDSVRPICSGIYVGGPGDISIVMAGGDGTPVVFKGAVAGTIIPVRAIRVTAAGTSAGNLVFLYGGNK